MQQTPSQSRCGITEKPALGLWVGYKPARCCSVAPELLQCYNGMMLQRYNGSMVQCYNVTAAHCYTVTMLQCDYCYNGFYLLLLQWILPLNVTMDSTSYCYNGFHLQCVVRSDLHIKDCSAGFLCSLVLLKAM